MALLNLATKGFFMYEVRAGSCGVFAAPRVKGKAAHTCTMAIDGEVTSSTVEGILKGSTANLVSPMDCTVSFGTNAPAMVEDVELIVNFSALCCGARLKPSWVVQESKHVLLQIDLAGGSLVAAPDEFTNLWQWKWNDCNGEERVQRITSLTMYTLKNWQRELRFVPRKKDGTAGLVKFAGDVEMSLLHKPVKADAEIGDVDDAHTDATKRLCSPEGEAPASPKRVKNVGKYKSLKFGESTRKHLGLRVAPLKVSDAVILTLGRPSCGARLLYAQS